jgi:hypothetical protein
MTQQDNPLKDNALASAQQVEQLADSLSQAANALHARIMRAIRQRPAGKAFSPPSRLAISADEARALFDDEVALRQLANRLYADAAGCALAGLEASQRSVLDAADGATKKIGKIDTLKDLINIGNDLLALAGAVVGAGQPEQIVAALEKLKRDTGSLVHA